MAMANLPARYGVVARTRGPQLPEPRDHLLREQLERLLAAVALEDALPEEQVYLVERDVARGVLDRARDRVRITDQERRPILAERRRPRVPHPEAVLGPRLGLALCVSEHEVPAPRRLLASGYVAAVLLGHLAIAAPEHLAEVHLA